MDALDLRLNPHLEAALWPHPPVGGTGGGALRRRPGLSALSAAQVKRRDALLAAQYIFRKPTRSVLAALHAEPAPPSRQRAGRQQAASAAAKDRLGRTLPLMDDDQVNALVAPTALAWRLATRANGSCGMSRSTWPASRSVSANPLAPRGGGPGLARRHPPSPRKPKPARRSPTRLTRALATEMRGCYADIAEILRTRGLRQQDLKVRGIDPARGGRAAQLQRT